MATHARFAEWIRDEGLTLREVATRLACSITHVSHLRSGHRLPSRRLATLIERETARWWNGPIRATQWDPPAAEAA